VAIHDQSTCTVGCRSAAGFKHGFAFFEGDVLIHFLADDSELIDRQGARLVNVDHHE